MQIGIDQARRGNVHGALLTADSMRNGYEKESVVYFACLELIRQGNRAEAEQLGRYLKSEDHQLPTESEGGNMFDWRSPRPIARHAIQGRCDALSLLDTGKVDEAAACVESRPNPADVADDLARLAERAADVGNLNGALKFTNNPHLAGTQFEDGYVVRALGGIGRLWATNDRSAALQWAQSRPNEYQRAIALAGVAEGVATSEPARH